MAIPNVAGGSFGADFLEGILGGGKHGMGYFGKSHTAGQTAQSQKVLTDAIGQLTASIDKLTAAIGAGVGRNAKGQFTSLNNGGVASTGGSTQSPNPIGGTPSSSPAFKSNMTMGKAAGAAAGVGVGAMFGQYKAQMSDLTQMDYAGQQMSRYLGRSNYNPGGYVGNLTRNTMYKGFNGGLNSQDYMTGTMATMGIGGYQPGSSGFKFYQKQVNQLQAWNPLAGLTNNAAALNGLYSTSGGYQLRRLGINPYAGGTGPGGRQDINSMAKQFLQRAGGGQKLTAKNITASLGTGGELSSYLASTGWSGDTQNAFTTALLDQANGGTATNSIVRKQQRKQNVKLQGISNKAGTEIPATEASMQLMIDAQNETNKLLKESGLSSLYGALQGFTGPLGGIIGKLGGLLGGGGMGAMGGMGGGGGMGGIGMGGAATGMGLLGLGGMAVGGFWAGKKAWGMGDDLLHGHPGKSASRIPGAGLGKKAIHGIGGIFGGGGPNSAGSTPTTGGGGTGAGAVNAAEKFLGTNYVWGGANPQTGFDCSGLTQYAYSQIGVQLPRTSQQQEKSGKEVSRDKLQTGDLVFYGEPAYHVGMYVGGGKMIDAPHTGAQIRIENLWGGESHFRRVVGQAGILASNGQNTTAGGSQKKTSAGTGGGGSWSGGSSEVANILSGLSASSSISFNNTQTSTVSATGSNAPSGAAPTGGLAGWEQSALKLLGLDYKTYSKGLTNLINKESSGNPKAQNNTDSNAAAGHPSKGLMQTIDSTFNKYALPGHTNIWNPVDNIVAGVRYIQSTYGLGMLQSGGRTDSGGNYMGYALGSRGIDRDQWARVHQGEIVFQRDTADAFREFARSSKGSGGGGGVNLNFGTSSIVINTVNADPNQASQLAKAIAQKLSEDQRLQNLASG